ncbi:hypothetical protein XELAEV_18005610mg [Xenopus laevis]|uniref:Interleukin n=1 Tax=Xenopus laevis TaxID=8355 RepID=A0A974I2S8_XENLA|nr:hypothetical protein XELAEV_18005610mg [Xenopus laevis]
MGTILLWCLLAFSCCLLIDAHLHSIERCKEIKKRITWIKKQANETAECLDSALHCFRYALPHLKEANGQKEKDFKGHIEKAKLSKMHTPTNKDCPICTEYPKQKPKDFLENMLLLLQQIMAENPTHTSG